MMEQTEIEKHEIIKKCYDDAMDRKSLKKWIKQKTNMTNEYCENIINNLIKSGLITKMFGEYWPTNEGLNLIDHDEIVAREMFTDIPSGNMMRVNH